MPILAIYNPQAGKKTQKDKQLLNLLKKQKIDFIWHDLAVGTFTKYNPNDFDRIFVCGGDGTVKEIASWLLLKKSPTPLAILPIGSANVLASALGVPFNFNKAIKLGLSNKIEKIDVGVINNRHYFLIATGCGFDAKVIKNTPRKSKKAWGLMAYAVSLVLNFFSTKANKFFIKIDDQSKTATAQSVFVSNFSKFFNISISPSSKINDGFLNVSILNTLNIRDLGILLYRFINGNYQKDWRYEFYKAKQVYILPFNRKTPMQIDGETVELNYLDIKILPQALKIIANKLP